MAARQPIKGDWPQVRVLVVDDDPAMADMVVAALGKLNIGRIRRAEDGGTAIEIFRQNPDIGLIVSDWTMPGTDGFAFLKAAREIKPDVPFFMLTGNLTQAYVQKALDAGVDGFIAKPFRPRDLQHKIHRILAQRYGDASGAATPKRAFGVER